MSLLKGFLITEAFYSINEFFDYQDEMIIEHWSFLNMANLVMDRMYLVILPNTNFQINEPNHIVEWLTLLFCIRRILVQI
jgi:hypothetical protein